MIRGLYIAGTNMLTANRRMEVVGNNMANVNTVGFKKDNITVESFNDVLISKRNGSNINMERPHGDINIENNDNDYRLNTEYGFFRTKTYDGVSNNKDIKFSVDQDGFLSTYYLNSDKTKNYNLGNRLIDNNGEEIQVGINKFEINKNGKVLVNGNEIAQLVKDVSQDVIGTINAGVKESRLYTDFRQGQMKRTGKATDIAIKGPGFFEVSSGENIVYSRNGAFTLNKNNQLVNFDGDLIQGIDGNITLPTSNIRINEFGEIIHNDEIIDKLKITDFSNLGDLRKIGGTHYILLENMSGEKVDFKGELLQGFLENSNTSAIEEMIKMTKLSKNYESSQKVISTLDKTLDKVINEVGVVR